MKECKWDTLFFTVCCFTLLVLLLGYAFYLYINLWEGISTDKYQKGWDDGYQSAKGDSFDAYLYSTGINSCQYFLKCIGCDVDCNVYFKEYPSECFKNIEKQIQQEGDGKK